MRKIKFRYLLIFAVVVAFVIGFSSISQNVGLKESKHLVPVKADYIEECDFHQCNLGHSSCGGVTQTLQNVPSGQICRVYGTIRNHHWRHVDNPTLQIRGNGCSRDVVFPGCGVTNFSLDGCQAGGISFSANDSSYIETHIECRPAVRTDCNLFANPVTIQRGQSSNLTWWMQGVTSGTINQGIGRVSGTGPRTVTPLVTTWYTLTVVGPDRTETCSAVVNVIQSPAPSCSLSANPTSVLVGGSSSLNWTTQNAVSATINQGIGSVTPVVGGTRTLNNLQQTTTYTMTVANSLGVTSTCSAAITVTQPPAPSCTISANPASITSGQSSILNWTSANATNATINQSIGSVALNGTRSVSPTQNATYTLTVANSAGVTRTCSATITVVPVPSCTITANPISIITGQSSTLTWTSANATSASINQNIGNVALNGNRNVSPTQTTTYTMTVANSLGATRTCTASVAVNQPPVPSCTITANPISIITGQSSTLTWTSANATTASINQNIGNVALNGNRNVSPTQTTVYTMTVANSIGVTRTCVATVTVTIPEPSCSLSANPANVLVGGNSTLSWTTQNAVSATIDQGIGAVTPIASGNRALTNIQQTTTYTMTVANSTGVTRSCSAVITATAAPIPSCSITANPASITAGQSSTLSWTSTNATTATLDQGIGSVALNGTRSVSPTATTTYTMTVVGIGGTRTCTTTLSIGPVAQLQITKTAFKNEVLADEVVVYTVVVRNISNTPTHNVRVTDSIPTDMLYVNNSITLNGTAVPDNVGYVNGDINVLVGTLAANQTATITYQLRVNTPYAGVTIRNIAVVDSDETNPIEDDAVVRTPSKGGHLTIEKVASVQEAIEGEVVTYTVTVRNEGSTTLHNVRVTDNIPTNMLYVNNSITLNGTAVADSVGYVNGDINVLVGTLTENQIATITYQLKVNTPYAGVSIRNIAVVDSDEDGPAQDDAVVRTPNKGNPPTGPGMIVALLSVLVGLLGAWAYYMKKTFFSKRKLSKLK